MCRAIVLAFVLCFVGCVQVVDNSTPAPSPAPLPTPDFIGADDTLVQQIVAASDLQDPVRLRKYAAVYKGVSDVIERETETGVMALVQAGIKVTREYCGPSSTVLGSAVSSRLKPNQISDSDRAAIVSVFRMMSASCHKAASQIEQRR